MGSNNVIPATIVSVVVLLILLVLITLMFMQHGPLDPNVSDFAKLLAGAVLAKFSTVCDFWIGDSARSLYKVNQTNNNAQSENNKQ